MASSLVFSVRRREAEMVAPAAPTPRELKFLSDIDDQETLRFQASMVILYPKNANPSMNGCDPAAVIKEALARALVFYYPLAGRLREGKGRKLAVDCTGEGVLFIEADADARAEQFYDIPMPPVPCFDELSFNAPGSDGLLGCPLLLIQVYSPSSFLFLFLASQVTRLRCGGFILAIRFNHTICDGPGLAQFLKAVTELARGASVPTMAPVWSRDVLCAPSPPRVAHPHLEYKKLHHLHQYHPQAAADGVEHRTFFYCNDYIRALRESLPRDQQPASDFTILTAAIWRSRTAALRLPKDDDVRLVCVMTAHGKRRSYLPTGFYGNAFVFVAIIAKAEKLCVEPLPYTVDLINKSKIEVTHDYMKSVAALMVVEGRPPVAVDGDLHTYLAADVTRSTMRDLDFGWGKAVYGAPGTSGMRLLPPWVLSYYVRFRNGEGEDRIVVPMGLPKDSMARFVTEMESLKKKSSKHIIRSHL